MQAIVIFSVVAWQIYYLKVCSKSLLAKYESSFGFQVFLRGKAYNLDYMLPNMSSISNRSCVGVILFISQVFESLKFTIHIKSPAYDYRWHGKLPWV